MSRSQKALQAMLVEGITLAEAAERYGISTAAVLKAKHHPSKKQLHAAELDQLRAQLAEAQAEIERLKGGQHVQLDIDSNNAGTEQQRELDGTLEMGQLLADSKDSHAGNTATERAKSLTWIHTGNGYISDSDGRFIGAFSGDFRHRDRLICAVNYEAGLRQQLAAAEAREAKLLEGVSVICGPVMCAYTEGQRWEDYQELLTQPRDDSALREMITKSIKEFVYKFKRNVGGDGEFWLHELEDFLAGYQE